MRKLDIMKVDWSKRSTQSEYSAVETRRMSHLCDMMVSHIIWGRTAKALCIAQYLRSKFGMSLVYNLQGSTGLRVIEQSK